MHSLEDLAAKGGRDKWSEDSRRGVDQNGCPIHGYRRNPKSRRRAGALAVWASDQRDQVHRRR
jgi:hypothetical protein